LEGISFLGFPHSPGHLDSSGKMEPDIYLVGHRCMKGLLGVAGYLICDPTKNEKNNTAVEGWMCFSPTWMFFVFHFVDLFLFSLKITRSQH